MRVLIVEDDTALLEIIREVFESESYQTDCADTGDEGYYLAQQSIYDLIILDIMLPGMNGIEVVKQLRSQSVVVPIILLTAKDAVDDRVAGLDAGADDYVSKPFAVSELLARGRAVLRRKGTISQEGEITWGNTRLVQSEREAYFGDVPLKLTITEYELLEFFVCHKDQILSREQIFDRIWGFNSQSAISAVDVYIHHLRKKLAAFGLDSNLRTVRGIGYIVKGEPDVQ
jgi:two-component system response regulator CiaR